MEHWEAEVDTEQMEARDTVETPAERATRQLTRAALNSLHIDLAMGLTPSVLRTIGNTLASYSDQQGEDGWSRTMIELRDAADEYEAQYPEVSPWLFPFENPFELTPAERSRIAKQLERPALTVDEQTIERLQRYLGARR